MPSLTFPPESLGFLKALSQAGLVIFIFLIGVRVDFAKLRLQSRVAVITSNVGVILLAQYLYSRCGSADRLAFSVFIGTAMSVTAFPVLARILLERNLLETSLGAVAIACAAVDDITAWTLLGSWHHKARLQFTPARHDFIYLPIYLSAMLILQRVLNVRANRVDEKKVPLNAILRLLHWH
jgi:Kef-type K+ transport system membrane component KefB